MKTLLIILSVFFITSGSATDVFAEGRFCYRDSDSSLVCNRDMEKIPEEFQKKAFFVSSVVDNTISSRSGDTAARPSLKHETHEIISPPSDYRRSHIRRDPPLAEKSHSSHSATEITPRQTSENATAANRDPQGSISAVKVPEKEVGKSAPAPVTAIVNESATAGDISSSELPPAKGYEPAMQKKTGVSNSEVPLSSGPEAVNKTVPPELPPAQGRHTRKTPEKNPDALVTIYVAEWCNHCKVLEKFLVDEKISYQRFDVEKDPAAIQIYEEHGSIPISKIGTNTVVGFEPERYRALLDASIPY